MIDFLKLIGDSQLYNFHSHTQFCDGRAPMADFARQAVEMGFTHYGFSPHSPIPIPSPCNMTTDDVAIYLAEVERLRKVYADAPTQFLASMEVDYLGPQWGPSNPYFSSIGLDYIIGSVHFIPSQSGELIDIDGRFESFQRKMAEHFRNDIHYVVNTYFDQSLEMLSRGGLDIIGHYDKVAQNASMYRPGIEEEGWFARRADELTDEIIQSGITVEINTKARQQHGRFFPAEFRWQRLVEAGAPLIVNSDAHQPPLINASRPEALSLLSQLRSK